MTEFFKTIAPDFVGGILALVCAVVGAKIATSASNKRAEKDALCKVYADVFSGIYKVVTPDPTDEAIFSFVTAVERARLLCSKESEEILGTIIRTVISKEKGTTALGPLVAKLRESAKKDVRKKKRR